MACIEIMTDELLSLEPIEASDMKTLAEWSTEYDPGTTLEHAIGRLITYALHKRAWCLYKDRVDEERLIRGTIEMGDRLAAHLCNVLDNATEPLSSGIDELMQDIMTLGERELRHEWALKRVAQVLGKASSEDAE